MTTAGDRARDLALESAHLALGALDLDPAAVDGATRVTVCTDAVGNDTDRRFGEYSSGTALGDGSLSDGQVDALGAQLGVDVLEDSTDVLGTRLVSFVVRLGGEDVIVRLSRTPAGSGVLTTATPCID